MSYANIAQPQPVHNKKLWIILGSIIGVLVLAMGGCVACGALIGLSAMSEQGGGSSSGNIWGGGGLASSEWKGSLSCDDGNTSPAAYLFSSDGYPIYVYRTSSGSKQEKLNQEGQTVRYAAAGGGVTTLVVESISVSSNQVNLTTSYSHQRAAGGTMIQSRSRTSEELTLSGSELDVVMKTASDSAASQPGYVTSGEEVTTCRGKLSRQ